MNAPLMIGEMIPSTYTLDYRAYTTLLAYCGDKETVAIYYMVSRVIAISMRICHVPSIVV